MTPDLITYPACPLTKDAARPKAKALARAGERLVAQSSAAEVGALSPPQMRVIDAGGAKVLPGFIEAHMHLFGAARLSDCQLMGKGIAALTAKVRTSAAQNPGAMVLCCQGADDRMLGGEPLDCPLVLVALDHDAIRAKTVLLERLDLLQGSTLVPDNEIVMAEDGLATGELRDSEACGPINLESGEFGAGLGLAAVDEPPRPEDRAAIRARHGVTSIQNMDGNLCSFDQLRRIDAEGDLICRVKISLPFKAFMGLKTLGKASAMQEAHQGDGLTSSLVRAFHDGEMEGFIGHVIDGGPDRPYLQGEPLSTQDQFTALAVEADQCSLQIAWHACGDGAVRAVLNGKGAARATNGARRRVAHVELNHPADAVMLSDDGEAVAPEAIPQLYPMRTLCDRRITHEAA